MKLNSDQLIAFSVVAELGSVSRAAERLHLSQPAVSGQLKALQEQVGEPLYVRKAQGVSLTKAGELLLPYAHSVARALRQASRQVSDIQQRETRQLRLGLSFTLSHYGWALAEAAQSHAVRLSLVSDDSATLAEQVIAGELDGALVLGPLAVATDSLDTHTLGEDELVMAVPAGHALAGRGYTPLHVLENETLLWAGRTSSVRRHIERLLEQAGVLPRGLELGSLCAVREALLDGRGMAILPREFVWREGQQGQLAILGIEAPSVTISKWLVTPPVAVQSEAHRRLTTLIQEVAWQSTSGRLPR